MGFRSAIDINLCSKPALSKCRGGFMGFRSAIDTNLCSKPALSKCRGGFYNYRFFPHPDVTKPAPTIAYCLFPIAYSLFPK